MLEDASEGRKGSPVLHSPPLPHLWSQAGLLYPASAGALWQHLPFAHSARMPRFLPAPTSGVPQLCSGYFNQSIAFKYLSILILGVH